MRGMGSVSAATLAGSSAFGMSDISRPIRDQVRVNGRLAQLEEHKLDKLGVTGSSPVSPTIPMTREG